MDRSEGESPGGGRSPPGFARDGGKPRRDVSNANMTAPEAECVSLLFNLEGVSLREVFGGIAQLVEHLLCKQGVIGSSPFTSTNGPIAQLARAHD